MTNEALILICILVGVVVFLLCWNQSRSQRSGYTRSAHPGEHSRYGGYAPHVTVGKSQPVDYHTAHIDAALNSAPENPLGECETNSSCSRMGQSDIFTECRHSSGRAGFCRNGNVCCPYSEHQPPQFKHDPNITGTIGSRVRPSTPQQIGDECEKRCGWQRNRSCYTRCISEFSSN